jgi:predicted  nucleic acid-binding Zn-ribbon protein
MEKQNTKIFIEKARKVHGNLYDYSKVDYVRSKQEITIVCSIHGEFQQMPCKHLMGHGCPECGKIKCVRVTSKETYIEKANLKHNNKYDYSKVSFNILTDKIEIICHEKDEFGREHGSFFMQATCHFQGQGCPKCGNVFRYNTENFIEKVLLRFPENNIYDYSKVDYIRTEDKVIIICPIHGEFLQSPHLHLLGAKCPNCRFSKGNQAVKDLLDKYGVKYEQEFTFEDCMDKRHLPFDFFLPELNMIIEYQGEQHFQPIYGEEKLKYTQTHDQIKRDFCKEHNIKEIEIHFSEDIEKKLKEKGALHV